MHEDKENREEGQTLTLDELFSVQKDNNKLKSLYVELADHENFNPYKNNVISDMPKGNGGGKDFSEWYAFEKERILGEIKHYKEKLQRDREKVAGYIEGIPYPECDIIRYRVINGLGWCEIGELLAMDRRTASRKFYNYVNLPTMPAEK